jgi:hypothetical protein
MLGDADGAARRPYHFVNGKIPRAASPAKSLAQPMLDLMARNFREIQVVPRGFSLINN